MKLIVEVPKEQYTTLNAKTQEEVVTAIDYALLGEAIKNGIPLPKGHGDLKDVDRLQEVFRRNVAGADAFSVLFDNAPTIIEADK